MRTKVIGLLLLGIVLGGAFVTRTQAQTFNKRTKVTFSQAVAVPGTTLPAGTYTFTIPDTLGSRYIVQIWNADKTELITTILAIPNYRLEPTDETVIEFRERPADRPQAVKAWFYPGYAYGIEFVYPKEQAIQLAQVEKEPVPAEVALPTPNTLKTVPLIAVTPQGEEEAVAQAFPEQNKEVAQTLPKTASLLPLIGLLGVTFVLGGLGLRRFATTR
jgi:hypothetical protein